MALVSGKCPICGAGIRISDSEERCFCTACGETIMTKAAIAYYDAEKKNIDKNESAKTSDPPETKANDSHYSNDNPSQSHTVLRSIGVGLLCVFAAGWCCQVVTAIMIDGLSAGGLLGWAIGIFSGYMYYNNLSSKVTVPLAVTMSSYAGVALGFIIVLIFIISNWGTMGEIASMADQVQIQANLLISTQYACIESWSSSFAKGELLNGGIMLFLHGGYAAILAGLIPVGISYICDFATGRRILTS